VNGDNVGWELMCREDWGVAEANARDVPCLDDILMRSPDEGSATSLGSRAESGTGTLASVLESGGVGTVCSRAMLASLVATTSGRRGGVSGKQFPPSPMLKAHSRPCAGEKRGGGSSSEASKSNPWRGIYRDRMQVNERNHPEISPEEEYLIHDDPAKSSVNGLMSAPNLMAPLRAGVSSDPS